jgi:glycosyltransferase involved in cell wall biosynthesis
MITNSYPDFPDSTRVVFIRKLAQLISERGWDVSVVTPRVFDGSKSREADGEVEVRRFASFLEGKLLAEREGTPVFRLVCYMLFGLLAAIRCVRERECDLIHAHWAVPSGLIALVAGRICRKPVLVTVHGSDLLVAPEKSRLIRGLVKFVLMRADAVTSVAEHLTVKILEMGIPADRVLTFPMSVPTGSFCPDGGTPVGWTGKPIIFSNRSHYPIYDIETLVRAIPIVLDKAPEAEFVIAGEGPEKEKLMSLANKLGVGTCVEFIGTIDHERMPEHLRGAAAYVSTALSDGASVSLLEAMACGAYPVVADIPANREWIEDEANGLLFEPGDPGSLADKILMCIGEKFPTAEARAANARVIELRAQWDSNIEKLLGLCERVMNRRQAGTGKMG